MLIFCSVWFTNSGSIKIVPKINKRSPLFFLVDDWEFRNWKYVTNIQRIVALLSFGRFFNYFFQTWFIKFNQFSSLWFIFLFVLLHFRCSLFYQLFNENATIPYTSQWIPEFQWITTFSICSFIGSDSINNDLKQHLPFVYIFTLCQNFIDDFLSFPINKITLKGNLRRK